MHMRTAFYLKLSRALSIGLIMLSGLVRAQQAPAFRPLQPTDATTAIIEAFHSYPIVALGEGPHGNEQGTPSASPSFGIHASLKPSTTSLSNSGPAAIRP